MKKVLVLCCSAALLFAAGCSSDKVSPKEVGENYMQKRFAGAEADLKDLNYTVVDAGEEAATVVIEGSITYKEKIFLKMKNGKWMVTDEAPEDVSEAAPAVEEASAEVAAEVEAEAPEAVHEPEEEPSAH